MPQAMRFWLRCRHGFADACGIAIQPPASEGDEFAILLEDVTDQNEQIIVAERIIRPSANPC